MESRFSQLLALESERCCSPGSRIHDFDSYYLQYVGLVVAGNKFIYINAFRSDPPAGWDSKELVDYCDGGSWFWGALYEPETGNFSELAFNGEA